jgi:hypothetical protein
VDKPGAVWSKGWLDIARGVDQDDICCATGNQVSMMRLDSDDEVSPALSDPD